MGYKLLTIFFSVLGRTCLVFCAEKLPDIASANETWVNYFYNEWLLFSIALAFGIVAMLTFCYAYLDVENRQQLVTYILESGLVENMVAHYILNALKFPDSLSETQKYFIRQELQKKLAALIINIIRTYFF